MKRQVFLNADSVVVNVIVGGLTELQQHQFLIDYGIMYGACSVIEIDENTMVWLGGTYSDGAFHPPTESPIVLEQ